jgi:hypothetical protein
MGWKLCGGTAKVHFVEGVSRFVRHSYAKRNMRHGVQDSNLLSYASISFRIRPDCDHDHDHEVSFI